MSTAADQWEHHPGRNLDGALTVVRPDGTATIGHVEDDGGVVLAWTGKRRGRAPLRLVLGAQRDPIEQIAAALTSDREEGR